MTRITNIYMSETSLNTRYSYQKLRAKNARRKIGKGKTKVTKNKKQALEGNLTAV